MRALDTNVLVRALVQDDAAQARRAQACVGAQPVFIPVTVILELEWVLRSRYGYSPKVIADALGEARDTRECRRRRTGSGCRGGQEDAARLGLR